MFTNLRFVNASSGILADYIEPGDGAESEYLDPGSEQHADALAGTFGPITEYIPPAEPEPVVPLTIDLPRREFRRALLHNGMDTAAILAVIEAIPDATEREEMQIWWEDTVLFQRNHPTLVSMVAAAGLTSLQGDIIWTYGVSLLNGQ